MIQIKVNNTLYPAVVDGRMIDRDWDDRESKSITLDMTYAEVLALLPDGTPWSIVQQHTAVARDDDGNVIVDESGAEVMQTVMQEWDNSEYSMSGDITDRRDGTVTIKMGKPTDLEAAYEMLIGG